MTLKFTCAAIAVCSALTSMNANAWSLNYRHEFLEKQDQQSDRLVVSHRFDNGWGFGVESKFTNGGEGEGAFDELHTTGTEYDLSYLAKPNDKWWWEAGFNTEITNDVQDLRVHFKPTYWFNPNFYTAARFRVGQRNYDDSLNKENGHYFQLNYYLGYNAENWSIAYDFEYKKLDYPDFNGEEYSYLNNVTIRVPINKNWRPFTEIGYVSYNDPADDNPYPNDWQWRWRVGIEYIF